jgi:hypothetical protein
MLHLVVDLYVSLSACLGMEAETRPPPDCSPSR